MTYPVIKIIGSVLLLVASAFFMFAAQFIYLGQVARVVDWALRISISISSLIALLSLFYLIRKQFNTSLLLATASTGISFLFIFIILGVANKPLLKIQKAADNKQFRQAVMQHHEQQVACKDSTVYTVTYPWGIKSLYWIQPENKRVEPLSIASFTIFEKSSRCDIYLTNTISTVKEEFKQCGEAVVKQVTDLVDDLKNTQCPYPDIRTRS
jgi:hypothetical protein